MKCVYCNKEADYILKGNSLCITCKEKEIEHKHIADNKLTEIGNKYNGNLGILKAFFNMSKQYIPDEVNELYKFKYVSNLIDVINKYNISPANIDNGIKIAMKLKKFDVGLVVHLMKQRQKADDKTNKDNENNVVTGFYKQRLEQEKNAK